MLVDDLKEADCKSSKELHSKLNVLLNENTYTFADLEHTLDWLAKSMVSMEKSFNRVKYEKEICIGSLQNVKDAYALNLENNVKLSNESKGFAYNLWRYNKKKKYLDIILDEVSKLPLWLTKRGRKIKGLIYEMEDKHKNYDKLTDIDLDKVDEKIQTYMERPVIFDANKISQEEFEKLTRREVLTKDSIKPLPN